MVPYPDIHILDATSEVPQSHGRSSTYWTQVCDQYDSYRIHYGAHKQEGYEELYRVSDDILLRIIDSEETQQLESEATNLAAHITLAYKLVGENTLRVPGQPQVTLKPGSLLLGYSSQQEQIIDRIEQGQRYAMTTLAIPPQALLTAPFHLNPASLPELIKPLLQAPTHNTFHLLQFDEAIQHCLQSLLTCSFSGALRKTFLQSKAHELICLTLDLIQRSEGRQFRHTMTEREQQQLRQVRDTLQQHYRQAPTLAQLAKQVGMSEAKLKKSFKQVYGTTIGECLQQLRMNQAQLLLRQSYSITQVAHDLGYEHASNFITAFKRQFGLTPKAFQKNLLPETESTGAFDLLS